MDDIYEWTSRLRYRVALFTGKTTEKVECRHHWVNRMDIYHPSLSLCRGVQWILKSFVQSNAEWLSSHRLQLSNRLRVWSLKKPKHCFMRWWLVNDLQLWTANHHNKMSQVQSKRISLTAVRSCVPDTDALIVSFESLRSQPYSPDRQGHLKDTTARQYSTNTTKWFKYSNK